MIERDVLDRLIDEWGNHHEPSMNGDKEWWLAHGVNHEAVSAFCVAQGKEDLQAAIKMTGGAMPVELLCGVISAAYEIGMIIGVKVEQEVRARGLH